MTTRPPSRRCGTSPVFCHRSVRAAVHSSGRALCALPRLTRTAGFDGIEASFSAARSTACSRRMRASVSGLVEIRRPCQVARAGGR
jgi:hypothetical protein